MKGIVLAGGTGSRLHPLTTVTNKHLLPVGNYPMIYHPVARLKQAGITDILIVTGRDHMGDVMALLGSGHDFGLDFTYKVQDQAGGIAQALGLARGFCCGDSCCVILGDNVFEDDLTPAVTAFMAQGSGARLLLKQVDDPERFGVAELSSDGHILGIEEKPQQPKSTYAVTGIYLYDGAVFDIIDTLMPSHRGELEITDVNNAYIQAGTCTYAVLEGWWTDAGTFPSLRRASDLAANLHLGLEEVPR
jgi:glucose-1-phosphate thymidylyltransferase